MPYRKTTVSGLRKAAILMVALPRKVSAELMANLDRESVETLTREIATLGEVTREQRDAVIEEFFQISLARQYVEQGGVEHARELLEQSLSPDSAREVLGVVQHERASQPRQNPRPAQGVFGKLAQRMLGLRDRHQPDHLAVQLDDHGQRPPRSRIDDFDIAAPQEAPQVAGLLSGCGFGHRVSGGYWVQ